MVEILRLQGELAGDLSKFAVRIRNTNNTTINTINTAVFVGSPLFARTQRMLVAGLAPYPGALEAVADGFARSSTLKKRRRWGRRAANGGRHPHAA